MNDHFNNTAEEQLIDLDSIFDNEIDSPTALSSSMQTTAKQTLETIKDALACTPSFINLVKSSVPQETFQAILTSDQKIKIASGTLKLMQKSDGNFTASLVNPSTGKIVSNIPIERIVDSANLGNALINFTMQKQLAQITQKLELIYESLEETRLGLERDRIAAALSCEQKLIQSMSILDSSTKTQALLRIAMDCEDSRNSIMKSQSANIDYLMSQPENIFSKIFSVSFNRNKKNDMCINEIRNSMHVLSMVSLVQALAYQELNEPISAKKSLEYFSNYIENTFLKPENLLQRLDMLDPSPANYWSNSLPAITNDIGRLSSISNFLEE